MFTSYHLVGNSPFPFFVSVVFGGLFFFGVVGFRYYTYSLFFFIIIFVLLCVMLWFSNIEVESELGFHSTIVVRGLRLGMILFIVSEVLFFFGFFWSFFHNCWSPSYAMNSWPPFGCKTFMMDPFGIPFLNTFYLLSSGVSMTFCHHLIISGVGGLYLFKSWFLTIFYGLLFLDCQLEEYIFSNFSLASSVYGSIMFMLTGFHGFHVFLGLLLLLYWFFRFNFVYEFSNNQHVSFEVAAWYWHFVDVVWLFLFVFVYWYNSVIVF